MIIYYYVTNGENQNPVTSRATGTRPAVTTATEVTVETEEAPETMPEEPETEPAVIPLTGNAQEILDAMTLEQKIYPICSSYIEFHKGKDRQREIFL